MKYSVKNLYRAKIIHSSIIKVMQEKIDFFMNQTVAEILIDYNAVSGQLTIINGKQQILCQRDDPKFDVFKEFEVSEEDVQHIQGFTGIRHLCRIKKSLCR